MRCLTRLLLTLGAPLTLLGCTAHQVSVIDTATNLPISGAWVSYMREYRGALQMHGGASCSHIVAAQTDSAGHVRLSIPLPPGPGESTYSYFAYKSGYQATRLSAGVLHMSRFVGSPEDRIDRLNNLSNNLSCWFGEAKSTISMHEAIVAEAFTLENQLADKVNWKLNIERLCTGWAYAALGPLSGGNSSTDTEQNTINWIEKNSPACFSTIKSRARDWKFTACKKSSNGVKVCTESYGK